MSDRDWLAAIVDNRQPMKPTPTDIQPQLKALPSLRAVIFDVYGTLLISGSGDVGTADEHDRGAFIGEAFAAVGCQADRGSLPSIDDLHDQIKASNESRKSIDCPKPEVDIVDVWRKTARHVGLSELASNTESIVRLAVEYESRANPTWPMPGAAELLSRLRGCGYPLGIVSNAQVFTIKLVENLLGSSLADGGFDLDLCIFSNRFRQAKPGPRLFDVLRSGLDARGIEPGEAIYVGNDMLNDVWAASQAGLKTAWFAGDGRSCRPRVDDPRCQRLCPDIVITQLTQLPDCLVIA